MRRRRRRRQRWGVVWAISAACSPNLAFATGAVSGTIEPKGGIVVADDRHAPGQTEGTFVGLAYGVDGALHIEGGRHALVLSMHVLEALGATIVTPGAVKVADDARASADYAFHVTPWFALSGWASAELPLFGSRTPLADLQPFLIQHANGRREIRFATSLPLTQPFAPLFVREGLGLCVKPLRIPFLTIEGIAGLGGEQALADGLLSVHDDPHTRVVDVTELQSYYALSPLLAMIVSGHIATRLAYAADVEIRFPLAHTSTVAARGLSTAELTEVDAHHSLRIEILPWLTVDYDLSVGVRPLLDSGVRIQNRLMLSARPRSVQ